MIDNQVKKSKSIVDVSQNPITVWLILGISICFTIFTYNASNKFVTERARDRFLFRAVEIENAIADRLRIYEQQLWSGVGLMYASDNVNRTEFAKFVETMSIEKQWPGIQGFGFSIPVKSEDKQKHIDAIRAEGFPDFTIKPEGERDMYSSIIYLEPFDWRNKRAFGYDMWSNHMRREAMTRARDEGAAATSGMITLVQETKEDIQKGFLTYVPVYKTKNIPNTVQERRDQFAGWVYAPYRAGNLMKGIIGAEDPSIEFEVFDGDIMNEETLLFDSNNSLHLTESSHKPDFKKTVNVITQGRLWTLYFNTPSNYLAGAGINQPRFIAIGGLVVNILIFYVIYSIYFLKKRAAAMARKMTKELEGRSLELELAKSSLELKVQERTQELEQAKANLESKVNERTKELRSNMEGLERANKAMVNRENRMIELKKQIKQLKEQLDQRA